MEREKIKNISDGLERTLLSIDERINKLRTRQRNSIFHGNLLLARGRAMKDLAEVTGNDEESLKNAIGSLTEAVNIFNRNRNVHGSVRAHYELGLCYELFSNLGDRESNLDIAIRALDEAKELINYDDDPDLYLMIENRLQEVWKIY